MSTKNLSLAAAYNMKRKNSKPISSSGISKEIEIEEQFESVADAILAKKRKVLDPIDEQEMDLSESFEDAAEDELEMEAEEAPKDESLVDAIIRKRSKKFS